MGVFSSCLKSFTHDKGLSRFLIDADFCLSVQDAKSGDRKIYSDFPTSFKTNSLFLVASNYIFISNFILILFFFSSVNSLIPAIGTRSCFPFCGYMHLYLPFFLIDILVGG